MIPKAKLETPSWGGARSGAGRKVAPGRPNVRHRPRADHAASRPVHVTMRAHRLVPWLRSERIAKRIMLALGKASRNGFRVLHFSVQSNHLHLLVEAEDRPRLIRGVQGLATRIAKQVNRLLGRRGKFWGDRYHARALRTAKQVRRALVYVLMNVKKHARLPPALDPYSSAWWLVGFTRGAAAERESLRARHGPLLRALAEAKPVVAAKSWLGRLGWKTQGLIRLHDAPKPQSQ